MATTKWKVYAAACKNLCLSYESADLKTPLNPGKEGKRIQFVDGRYATNDSGEIKYLDKKMKDRPDLKIKVDEDATKERNAEVVPEQPGEGDAQ